MTFGILISGAIPAPFDLAMSTNSSKVTKEYLSSKLGLSPLVLLIWVINFPRQALLLNQQNKIMSIMTFGWSWLLKCFYISTDGAHDPMEPCKYGYNCQAKKESESRGSHLNPNPRTNKHDFWAKIDLILYPSLGNLTTHIAIPLVNCFLSNCFSSATSKSMMKKLSIMSPVEKK